MVTAEIWEFPEVEESQHLGQVVYADCFSKEQILVLYLLHGDTVAEIFCYSCKRIHLSFPPDWSQHSLPLDPALNGT